MTIDASLNARLRRVVRTHDRMKHNGVVHRVGRDGLIRTRPRLFRRSFPLRIVIVLAVLFFLFKAIVYAQIGSGNYALKVEELRNGTQIEQVGAFLMQEDPVTIAVGDFIKPYVFER